MTPAEYELRLTQEIAETFDDPLAYVLMAFPWGVKGGPLEDQDGPDQWQREQLEWIGSEIRSGNTTALQDATASGHGIGKSAETAWIILWAMSTRPHLNGVVTANSYPQLKSKTWRELSVWHKRAINSHWFSWTATSFYHIDHPETWVVNALANTEHNSESFAGLHAKYVLVIFDEASGIADKIWEVTEGAMTTPGAMWFVFGNPTKNTGRFRECFGRLRHRWHSRQVDSRSAKMANNEQIEQWRVDYGEDSDFFKVRVKGEFPSTSSSQMISSDSVERAVVYQSTEYQYQSAPKILGVDVARFGDDKSVITRRQGNKVFKQAIFSQIDLMALASRVAMVINNWQPDAVFIDGVGVGAGVVDRLRQLGFEVIDVQAGAKASDPRKYKNKRTEMWGEMSKWLSGGSVDIPNDRQLKDDLIGPEYGFDANGVMILEKKDDMKRRGLSSPDLGDSLALTFADVVEKRSDVQQFYDQSSFEPADSEIGY